MIRVDIPSPQLQIICLNCPSLKKSYRQTLDTSGALGGGWGTQESKERVGSTLSGTMIAAAVSAFCDFLPIPGNKATSVPTSRQRWSVQVKVTRITAEIQDKISCISCPDNNQKIKDTRHSNANRFYFSLLLFSRPRT
jgi:hypothetical protein